MGTVLVLGWIVFIVLILFEDVVGSLLVVGLLLREASWVVSAVLLCANGVSLVVDAGGVLFVRLLVVTLLEELRSLVDGLLVDWSLTGASVFVAGC